MPDTLHLLDRDDSLAIATVAHANGSFTDKHVAMLQYGHENPALFLRSIFLVIVDSWPGLYHISNRNSASFSWRVSTRVLVRPHTWQRPKIEFWQSGLVSENH